MSEPHIGDLFFFSYAGDLVLSRSDQPSQAVSFDRDGVKCSLLVPQRTRPIGWRSSPPITKAAVAQFIPAIAGVDNFPPSTTILAGLNEQGQLTLYIDEPNSADMYGRHSVDTFVIEVIGLDSSDNRAAFATTMMAQLFRWLRVETDQWWAGRTSMISAPTFLTWMDITAPGRLSGAMGSSPGSILAHTIAGKAVTTPIWRDAVNKVAAGLLPTIFDEAFQNVAYYQAQGEQMTCLLLGVTAIEQVRDDLAETGKLKPNGVDILKHLTVDMQKGCQRNIQSEKPDLYSFLRDTWIARGRVAHGKPFFWKSNPTQTALPGSFARSIREVLEWMQTIQ
ncbi:hypothetical protein [Rhizobium leguminosarum]|uniref:hypothetical protein n=1 Tax=Rhizobium leguminosarum TaxID=384 RepID=UPI00103B8336|nr:hypothetical protein [Rhizobium leguminosarum]TBY86117.1 hypothetical protein E0H32_02705 [Rhizobium leguminosarum bv. viciae]